MLTATLLSALPMTAQADAFRDKYDNWCHKLGENRWGTCSCTFETMKKEPITQNEWNLIINHFTDPFTFVQFTHHELNGVRTNMLTILGEVMAECEEEEEEEQRRGW